MQPVLIKNRIVYNIVKEVTATSGYQMFAPMQTLQQVKGLWYHKKFDTKPFTGFSKWFGSGGELFYTAFNNGSVVFHITETGVTFSSVSELKTSSTSDTEDLASA